ncbi:pll, partial [Drosophila busckii]
KIGYGSFGDVFKAIWGQRIVAVKSIDYHDEKTKQKVDKEVKHLSTVCHENIIRLYGVSLDAQAQKTLLIMEYAENGSL